MFKDVSGRPASTKALLLSVILAYTGFEAVFMLHTVFIVNCLVKNKALTANLLHASGNMIAFGAQMFVRASMPFARTSKAVPVPHMMAQYFWFNHELRAFKALRCSAEVSA